jgi:hypothetical protein
MGVDHDSKVAIAKWLKAIWVMHEESYDFEKGRYMKTRQECVDAVMPEEDDETKNLIFVLVGWTADCENFVNKYATA